MKIFGFDINIKKASGNGNVPLDISTSGSSRATGAVAHDDYEKLMKQYKNWVYVGVFKNAVTVARYPLKLYATKKHNVSKIISPYQTVDKSFYKFMAQSAHLRKYLLNSDEIVEIIEHPLLDLLNTVNPQMNRFELFSKTSMTMDLTGNSYWYLVLNGLGLPVQIWPVAPQNMKANVSEQSNTGDFITGYTFRSGVKEIPLKREEIIHFTFPSPYSNIYGFGALAAGQESISFDTKTREYENVLLDNQCRPDVVLQTEQKINDEEAKSLLGRIRNSFSGRKGLGRWMILDKGLSATPLNMPLRDMGFVQGRKASKEEIAGLLGIPVSKLTTEDVNLANAYVGSVQYITDTIFPRLILIEEKLNERLVPRFDENLFVTYGNIIPSDKNYRLSELETHLSTQYSTINEERKIDGLEPVEWGDKPVATAPPAGVEPEKGAEEKPNPFESSPEKLFSSEEQEELIDDITSRVISRVKLMINNQQKGNRL